MPYRVVKRSWWPLLLTTKTALTWLIRSERGTDISAFKLSTQPLGTKSLDFPSLSMISWVGFCKQSENTRRRFDIQTRWMAQKVRLFEEGGLRKIGGWHKKVPLVEAWEKVLDGNDGMCSGISGSRVFPHRENYASARQCTRTTKNWLKRQEKAVKYDQNPSTTTKKP